MIGEPLDWVEGAPRSRRFDDVYFSAVDGLAESRAVYLAGCGLPEAWAGRDDFTVAELGFGTGLNILALVELWRRTRRPGARLHVFSVEAYPMTGADAARALGAWPELADLARPLLAAWPARRGLHRIDFPGTGATLDLAIAEAEEALAGWDGLADAWFLDGFAPARNPEMWGQPLLDVVAARSAPGAIAATFTVAGAVRRGLAAAGFAVDKRPGFGRKRERLEARLPGSPALRRCPSVVVVGAGIAGAALARALRAQGCAVSLVEAEGIGAGASGNPVALVTPRLDAGLGVPARLHAQAFARAVAVYRDEAPDAILRQGVVQLARDDRDRDRFARLAAWDGFAAGSLTPLAADAVAAALNEAGGSEGLLLRDALAVDPAPILARWLKGVDRVRGAAAALAPAGEGWQVLAEDGRVLAEADTVCLAAGPASAALAGPLRLQAVRGQLSWAAIEAGGSAAAWGGYVAPLAGRVLFGATHGRDDWGTAVRPEDHRRNLTALAQARPGLARAVEAAGLEGRASLRAASPDHMPVAGAVAGPPGLMVLSGLGGRGFSLAPLLAEQVAAVVAGAPRPLPRDLADAIDPGRFRSAEG